MRQFSRDSRISGVGRMSTLDLNGEPIWVLKEMRR